MWRRPTSKTEGAWQVMFGVSAVARLPCDASSANETSWPAAMCHGRVLACTATTCGGWERDANDPVHKWWIAQSRKMLSLAVPCLEELCGRAGRHNKRNEGKSSDLNMLGKLQLVERLIGDRGLARCRQAYSRTGSSSD